jgi:excisionase family DNA binding protein
MVMQLLTVDEAAQLLRVSRDTVYRLAGVGALPGRRIGRLWRFSATAIEAYLSGQAEDAVPSERVAKAGLPTGDPGGPDEPGDG